MEVVQTVTLLAASEIDEAEFSAWLREHAEPIRESHGFPLPVRSCAGEAYQRGARILVCTDPRRYRPQSVAGGGR